MIAVFPLTDQVRQAGNEAIQLHSDLAYRLGALLRVAENLADCHRVLGDFKLHARATGSRDSAVFEEACGSWRNPTDENGFELIRDLMLVAQDLCGEAADQAESLGGQIGVIGMTVTKIAQFAATVPVAGADSPAALSQTTPTHSEV